VLLPLLFWLTERITITTRRIILRRGMFVRHRSEIPLSRIREVSSRSTIVQRMFRAGDIELKVGADARLVPDVPGVNGVIDALQALIERDYQDSMQYRGRLSAAQASPSEDVPDFWS